MPNWRGEGGGGFINLLSAFILGLAMFSSLYSFCELFSLIVSCFYEPERAEYSLLVNIASYNQGQYSVVVTLTAVIVQSG